MKKKVIIAISFIIVLLCILIGLSMIMNNRQSEKYTIENIKQEYFILDNSVVATINDQNITNKDICLIKYLYHTKDALNQTIEQKSIVQLSNDDGFSLSESELEKESDYIDKVYEKLNLPSNEENIAFRDDLKRNHLEMVTSIKYQSYIEKQITNQEFNCNNKTIKEKYEKFKSLYIEWENGGKENSKLYKKIWSLREEIAENYIQYRIKELDIVIY